MDETLVERALATAIERYADRPDVTAIDRGTKYKGGTATAEPSVRIHVRQKLPPGLVPDDLVIPASIEGVTTDVIEARYVSQADVVVRRRGRTVPLRPGVSVAGVACRAGTLGAIVFDRNSRQPLLLSAAHVLVSGFDPEVGDRILQPARDDGGRADRDTVAKLFKFFVQDSWRSDAAVARLDGTREFSRVPVGAVRALEEVRTAQPGMLLQKSGRTTGTTQGVVDGRGLYKYPFAPRGVVGFRLRLPDGVENTVLDDLSGPGDSGALWYGEGGRIGYGIHGAGDVSSATGEFAIACDLEPALRALGVTLSA